MPSDLRSAGRPRRPSVVTWRATHWQSSALGAERTAQMQFVEITGLVLVTLGYLLLAAAGVVTLLGLGSA